jgi:signal peptidase I
MTQWLKDNRAFVVFILCFGVFRTAVADWNPIPSGSMRPTLLEGDVVLVDRLAYDLKLPLTDRSLKRLADPQRGDVVTFSSPTTGTRLIKRVVALPGDVVQLQDGGLWVNGMPAHHGDATPAIETLGPGVAVHALQTTETLAGHSRRVQHLRGATAARQFGPLTLGEDQFFMLGDNRDNSKDSRFIGPVPRHLLIGRAHHVLVSVDITGHWWPRVERTVSAIR